MRVSDFDYCLPDELIAQEPLECRDASRLMVLHRQDGTIEHRTFRDLPEYLRPDDVCILNDTRVIKARLKGQKSTGGTIWVLLLRPQQPDVWEALVKPGRKAAVGTVLQFGDSLQGVILDRTEQGGRLIRLVSEEPLDKAIESAGEVPLPP